MKDWKERFERLKNGEIKRVDLQGVGDNNGYYEITRKQVTWGDVENFIEQIISERDKEWEKWKVLAEAMDNAPVGHRVTIKHLLGEDEWTLTKRNK